MVNAVLDLPDEVLAASAERTSLLDRKSWTLRAYEFQKAGRQADAARIFRAIEDASVHAAPSRFGPPAFHFPSNGPAALTDQRLRSQGHR
jgi:hypothetical protein